jgi:hypothetical protein
VREGLKRVNCDQIVTKSRALQRKTSEEGRSRKLLTESWQRDLADFISVSKPAKKFQDRGFQPLEHFQSNVKCSAAVWKAAAWSLDHVRSILF